MAKSGCRKFKKKINYCVLLDNLKNFVYYSKKIFNFSLQNKKKKKENKKKRNLNRIKDKTNALFYNENNKNILYNLR